jgi:hypothetical protein
MAHRWHSHRRLGSSQVIRLPPERGVRAESATVHEVISYLAALIAGAVALVRSPRLQAPQADGTGPGGVPRERRERPVKAAGHR